MDDTAIALITYNRPRHTAQVLKALQKQGVHNLFIFSDGPKTASDESSVEETRQLFDKIEWTHPTVIKRERNHGLAWSIVAAADELFETFPRLIVLEDDCVPQLHFFDYMQTCLDRYANTERIFGISGYGVPLEKNLNMEYPFDIYYFPRIGSWGWATWRRAWTYFERDLQSAYDQACQRGIDLSQGGTDVPLMIKSMLAGNLKDVWSLNWMMSLFLHQGLYVYPTRSHIDNIGMDGSGVHCGASKKYQTTIANKAPTRFPSEITVDQRLSLNFRRYYDLPQSDRSPSPMRTKPLKVVHLNTMEFGGAAKAACRIHDGLLTSGIDSTLIVLETRSASPHIKAIPFPSTPDKILPATATSRTLNKTRRLFQHWQKIIQRYPDRPKGLELFSDTDVVANLGNVKDLIEADLIHLHWVAGLLNYRDLPASLFGKPVIWTLHDMNPFTGGCHYANDCNLYEKACGRCPQIGSSDHSDLSSAIWQKKQQGLRNLDLTVVTPSDWLKNCVERSSLMDRCPVRTIANGIPTDVFQPRHLQTTRERFDLPAESRVILFGAADIHNERKGFRYFIESLSILKKGDAIGDDLRVVVFGNSPNDQGVTLPFPMVTIGPVNDDRLLSEIYSMADVFVLPSLEDNLPNTAIEAMACGTPVVGFNSGGIAEIVDHKKTGCLAARGDTGAMADGIRWLLSDRKRHRLIRQHCRKSVLKRYDHRKQAERYQALYREVISRHTTWEKERLPAVDDHNQRAEDFIRLDDGPSALNECHSALIQNPGVAKTHNNLGVAYVHSNALTKALYHHNVAHLLDPENKTFAKNFADVLWFARQDTQTTLPIYRRFLQMDPEDVEILYALGCISEQQGQQTQAQKFFRRILAIQPHDEPARLALRRLTSTPNGPPLVPASAIHYREIEAMLSTGDRDAALTALQAFVLQFPDFPQAQNDLGAVYAGKHDFKHALKYYSHAVALDPANPLFRKNLADLYITALGRIPEAMAIYTDILKRHPADEEALLGMAFAAHKIGHDADGLELVELCLKVNPDNRDARALKSAIVIKPRTEANRHAINEGEPQRSAISGYHEHGMMMRPSVSATENTGIITTAPSDNVDFHHKTIEQRHREKLGQRNRFRVSAVVSTYASERFIEGRLQNLVGQTLFKKGELEILVVDSNSPENERALVDRFSTQHSNIRYLRTPGRETVYAAWNRGIEMARGTYFVNANTDDRFAPDALEAMADILDTHPEYDAAYGNWIVTRTPNDTFESCKAKRLFKYPDFNPGLFFYLQITSHANFVRRSVFEQIGNFDGSYTVFGDREFMFRFSAAGLKALKLEKTVGLYLENPTSVERANKDIGLKECAVLYDYYLAPERFAGLMGHGKEVSPGALSKDYTEVGCFGMGLYCVDGKSRHALGSPTQLFAKAVELDPDNVEALNNMGVIAQHRRVSQDAVRFFNNARAVAQDTQKKIIDHNQELARQGISDPNQLRFLFPSGFRSISVTDSKYPSGRNQMISSKKGSTVKPKKRVPVSIPKNRRKKKQTSNSHGLPIRQTVAWNNYLKENFSSALVFLQDSLVENPEYWEAYELLVDVMLQSGQDANIPETLRPLENRSGVPANMLALIGSGYEAAGDLSRALQFADRALGKDANCARGWSLKGVIEYRLDNREAAARYFQKASDCDANWGDPWTNLGMVHWDQGEIDTALDFFEKGFGLSPTDPHVATTYHSAISESVQYERARVSFENTVKRYPDFRKARFLLIDILIHLEAYQGALDQIESVLVRFGADPLLLHAAKVVRDKVGPLAVAPGKHPSLSLCMIVKNEEKYLPRCLESLKPIVNEMIVVDTGSTDATRDIAEVFGARVFDFEWNDDFSAARNFSLEQASGDWILVMDADEVIATKDHNDLIKQLRESPSDKIEAYMMTTRNYTARKDSVDWIKNTGQYPDEETNTGWVPSRKARLFRNRHDIHFVFPVHEQVDPVIKKKGIRLIECPVPVHHYGKLDLDRISERWHMYYEIGKQKLQILGNDKNAIKELAIQAALLAKWDEAATHWGKYLDLVPGSLDAYMNLTRIMAESGNFKQANLYAREAVQLATNRPEPLYNLSLSELQLGLAEEAAKTIGHMLQVFPEDSDGHILRAIAEICAGNKTVGVKQYRRLIKKISKESISSRTLSILSSMRKAGLQDWIATTVGAISHIDGLQKIETALFASPVSIPYVHPDNPIKNDVETSKPLAEARRRYESQDYQTSLAQLTQLLEETPEYWEAYELLVDVMLQSGQDANIPETLRPLENRSGVPANMLALIGSGYEAAGDLSRALQFADRALGKDANCARGWSLKGVIEYRLDNREAAARYFQKASDCDANWGDPWTNLGMVHWDQGEIDTALDFFEKGFGLSPTDPHVATTYHSAISESVQYERARVSFENTVKRYPDFRKARFLLIDILIHLEAYQGALDQIESVLVRFGADPLLLHAAKVVRDKVGPLAVAPGKHPSLSLCMIVKNEEKYLPRCLESLKPIVNEMIVVDTGSTDATRDIAEVFGARVFDFEWNDDFSAARNFSLEQASGDWILVMDADEVIATKDHGSISKLLSQSDSNRRAFMIVTRNYTNQYNNIGWEPNVGQYSDEETGTGWIPSEKVRLFPNDNAVRFQYPVHEVVGPSLSRKGISIKACPYPVHHYGKLDQISDRQKDERYYKIGMDKLSGSQDDPVAIREMAVQAAKLGKNEEAVLLWKRMIKLEPNDPRSFINLASSYGKRKQYPEAKTAARKAIKLDPHMKEGHLNLGLSELHLGNITKAEAIFERLVYNDSNYHSAVFLLGATQLCLEKTVKAIKTLKSLHGISIWNNMSYSCQELIESLMAAGWIDLARNLIDGAVKLNCSNEAILEYRRRLELKTTSTNNDEDFQMAM